MTEKRIRCIHRDVESRILELQDQVRQLKQLFKPWPPPGNDRAGKLSPREEKLEEPEQLPAEVIPAEEQVELDRIEKLLTKAQIARRTHRKNVKELNQIENSQKENLEMPVASPDIEKIQERSCLEKAVFKDDDYIKKNPTQEKTLTKDVPAGSRTKEVSKSLGSNTRRTPDGFTGAAKDSVKSHERTEIKQSNPGKSLSKTERPTSSSGKRKVVPAHINAPFQTNPNLRTSKLQSTYRAATSAKSAVRGRGMETGTKRRVGISGSARTSQSIAKEPDLASHRKSKNDSDIRSFVKDPKAVCDNSNKNHNIRENGQLSDIRIKENRSSDYKIDARVKENSNSNNASGDKVSIDKLHETVIGKNSGIIKKDDEDKTAAGDDSDKLFDLKRDGSAIEIPAKLRKYFSINTKLRRKYNTQALTQKVDSPSSGQDFSRLLGQAEKFGENSRIQSLAKQAVSFTKAYSYLWNVLDSLHLDHVTANSSVSELLHSRKYLEFLLTDFQETEELFHKTDFRLLRSIPTCHRVMCPDVQKGPRNPVIWYNKFSGIPGHRSPETMVYNNYKDLEKYRALLFQTQFITTQLEIMDSAAELILPVLKSLDPASREFLSVLRCGYELMLTSNSSPVVVKDTIEEDL